MTAARVPGLYRQQLDPVRPAGPLARGDVPVLFGYTLRGPVSAPVRVDSLQQFEAVFGSPPRHGHLWHAVKGFFETGGGAAYVVRVATDSAWPAQRLHEPTPPAKDSADHAVAWWARASFPWPMIDPRRLEGADPVGIGGWLHVFEQRRAQHGMRSPDAGSWGNTLSVRIQRTSRVRTMARQVSETDETVLRVNSLAGLDAHSVLELTRRPKDGAPMRITAIPASVDPDRSMVHLPAGAGFTSDDPGADIRIASVEFDITVLRSGKAEQSFTALGPHPEHPESIVSALTARCRDLVLIPEPRTRSGNTWERPHSSDFPRLLAETDWSRPDTWPREGTLELGGGSDGLEDMDTGSWLSALGQAGQLEDAALIACPDVVLRAAVPPPATAVAPVPADCNDLSHAPRARLAGFVVTDGEGADSSERPLPQVTVVVAGSGLSTTTDTRGRFTLEPVDDGLVTLRLRREGYESLEFLAQSSPKASTPDVRIEMVRISTPRPLDGPEILAVQQTMADPAVIGRYKVTILDAPAPDIRLDEILTWRARLGSNARMGLFAPWLLLPDAEGGTQVPCPPSGHVCGAFAAAERTRGLHHSGANRLLRYVDGTTMAIDDALQAEMNPAGVNAIRAFPGRGIRINGTRSLAAEREWRFLTSRRIVDAVEKTLEQALRWMVFEPNNVFTRHAVEATAETLLERMHRQGVLAGTSPEASFSVRCDDSNNPQHTREIGTLVADIAIAPSTPYEFVLFRLGHTFDAHQITEEH